MKIETLTPADFDNPPKTLTNIHKYDTLSESATSIADSFRITDIRQAVKNPNRANIFIDDKFDFSLSISQLADTKLKIGQPLTATELANLRVLSSLGKLYQRALEWVLIRPRSIKETRDYLRRKQASPSDTDVIIAKLTSKNYLNDTNFTAYYTDNRFAKKGISVKRLTGELRAKGISPEIITNALSITTRTDAQEITKIITKKSPKYKSNPQKLIQYLARQGFDYETVRTAVLEMDSQNSE